jgi:serine/threonine-protein kinase RsbT
MSRLLRSDTIQIRVESDIVLTRLLAKEFAVELGFNLLDLTKIVTAASELGRNTLLHGLGGTMIVEALADNERRGLRLTFEDNGPGIADLAHAMVNGFTTKRGLGLGLGGSKRLVDEFQVSRRVGGGICVTVTRWK